MCQGFNKECFKNLYKDEGTSFWFNSRNKLIIWITKKYFYNFSNFLEIGCGTGYVLRGIKRVFPNRNYLGSELFLEGLNYAKKRLPDVDFFQLDATNLNMPNKFDIIGAFDVLEHIEKDELILKNMYISVKRGGGIILTVPQHQFLWSQTDVIACHVRRYSKKDLINKIRNSGFNVVYVSSFVSLLMPFMIVSRKINFKPTCELKINPVIDYIFRLIMLIERFFICIGIRFPFGGSLIVVAKKEK